MYAPELKGNSDELKLRVEDVAVAQVNTNARATPTDIYIPKDLDDCFAELKRIVPKDQIDKMKNGTEDDMSKYHFSLGMWLRNNWGLRKGSQLSKWFNEKGIGHPDDMSGIILDSFWRHLNNKPIQLDEQIRYYRDYWNKLDGKK